MSKPVLGRSLGELMQGQPAATKPAESAAPRVSPGFDRMVAKHGPQTNGGPAPMSVEKTASLKLALFAGDAALCALAAWFAFSRRGTLGAFDVLLCVAAVLVGTALGWRALTPDLNEP
ncbi:MAG: hypothetical protein HY300_06570 [Verrucomicrobia bacterium]|nr:hypothetical protein [Verrucomicrobiota bacterium]